MEKDQVLGLSVDAAARKDGGVRNTARQFLVLLALISALGGGVWAAVTILRLSQS